MILGGVTIGEGAVIQARSVVCKDVPPLAIAGGHPAIPFKYRDKEHYDRLKAEEKFILRLLVLKKFKNFAKIVYKSINLCYNIITKIKER